MAKYLTRDETIKQYQIWAEWFREDCVRRMPLTIAVEMKPKHAVKSISIQLWESPVTHVRSHSPKSIVSSVRSEIKVPLLKELLAQAFFPGESPKWEEIIPNQVWYMDRDPAVVAMLRTA